MAGAPLGNQNAARPKIWRDAIARALKVYPDRAPSVLESSKGLDEAAYKFVTCLMESKDLGFFKEFGDRLDGKPAQAIVGDDDLPPVRVYQKIERSLVDPADTDGKSI